MKKERYINQWKIFGEIFASKIQGQHAAQLSVCKYESLCPATKIWKIS